MYNDRVSGRNSVKDRKVRELTMVHNGENEALWCNLRIHYVLPDLLKELGLVSVFSNLLSVFIIY
jgi:hypothetical protein